jgi:hydrogenase nickel insertion protein HypA
MHEYSVVQALLNQCEEVAEENDASKVTKVICKIGVMSGIEIHLLQVAFDTFKEGTLCDGAEFVINEQKLVVRCRACRAEYEIDEINYKCTSCGHLGMDTIDGEDMYLMSLEME